MSIADKITQLDDIRASMREKLVAKGVDASTHNFADFPNDVESIPSGSNDGNTIQYNNNTIKISDNRFVQIPETRCFGRLKKDASTAFVFNPATANNYVRIVYKFKIASSLDFSIYPVLYGGTDSNDESYCGCGYFYSGNRMATNIRSGTSKVRALNLTNIQTDKWYYIASVGKVGGAYAASLYGEDGELIQKITATDTYTPAPNTSIVATYGGRTGSTSSFAGQIDLTETFYEIDGICVWGKTNSKTQNMGLEA